ncbi:hypothetical protein ABG508_004986, partial [Escherichia coli]
PQRSKLPRYVVKLHEDDFLMKKGPPVEAGTHRNDSGDNLNVVQQMQRATALRRFAEFRHFTENQQLIKKWTWRTIIFDIQTAPWLTTAHYIPEPDWRGRSSVMDFAF